MNDPRKLGMALIQLADENDRLKRLADRSKDYASTIRACEVMGKGRDDFSWKKLKEASQKLGIFPYKVASPGYAHGINVYPREAWYQVYPDAACRLFEAV